MLALPMVKANRSVAGLTLSAAEAASTSSGSAMPVWDRPSHFLHRVRLFSVSELPPKNTRRKGHVIEYPPRSQEPTPTRQHANAPR
eukprot:scaffold46962_cov37-Tisochrysis_lutea.AAC.1